MIKLTTYPPILYLLLIALPSFYPASALAEDGGGSCGKTRAARTAVTQGAAAQGVAAGASQGVSTVGGQSAQYIGSSISHSTKAVASANTAVRATCDALVDCSPPIVDVIHCSLDVAIGVTAALNTVEGIKSTYQEIAGANELGSDVPKSVADDIEKAKKELDGFNNDFCRLYPESQQCDPLSHTQQFGADATAALYGVDPDFIDYMNKQGGPSALLDRVTNEGTQGIATEFASQYGKSPSFSGIQDDAIAALSAGPMSIGDLTSEASSSEAGLEDSAGQSGDKSSGGTGMLVDLNLDSSDSQNQTAKGGANNPLGDFLDSIKNLLPSEESEGISQGSGAERLAENRQPAGLIPYTDKTIFQITSSRYQNSPKIQKLLSRSQAKKP